MKTVKLSTMLVFAVLVLAATSCKTASTAASQESANDAEAKDKTMEPSFPLEVGDTVPDFELPAHDGSTFKLSDHRGKKVLLSTFPKAMTSVCTKQTCYVNDSYDQFVALKTVPFGMSTDKVEKLAAWAKEQSYRQLLLSDNEPKGEVSKMFGLYNRLFGVTGRANLIIGEDGRLIFKKVYGMPEQPDFDEIFTFLKGT